MIQVMPMGSEQMRGHSIDPDESVPENDQALLDLLLVFHKLFEEPSGLPPSRGCLIIGLSCKLELNP